MNKDRNNLQSALALGTEPVGKLLVKYATPAIIAMVASSLYNMVDSIFIGQGVGPLAISGLAITFPLMNISAAFGAAIGVGAATVMSVRLGQKDYETAQVILGNSVVLKILTGIVFGGLSLLFLNPILTLFGATDATLPYAREYMTVILLGNVFTHLYFGLNGILRAVGKPRHAMYATIFTVVLNTALDPLFIYTFGMGIRGAALATVISQTTALAWQMWIFSDKNELVHFRSGIWQLRGGLVKSMLAIGASPFAMNVCACIVVILINTALVRHGGDLAVGAYGIANRIGFLFFMIVMGINQGMQPIASYNFGAGKGSFLGERAYPLDDLFPQRTLGLCIDPAGEVRKQAHGEPLAVRQVEMQRRTVREKRLSVFLCRKPQWLGQRDAACAGKCGQNAFQHGVGGGRLLFLCSVHRARIQYAHVLRQGKSYYFHSFGS